jgi:hypothetical protein
MPLHRRSSSPKCFGVTGGLLRRRCPYTCSGSCGPVAGWHALSLRRACHSKYQTPSAGPCIRAGAKPSRSRDAVWSSAGWARPALGCRKSRLVQRSPVCVFRLSHTIGAMFAAKQTKVEVGLAVHLHLHDLPFVRSLSGDRCRNRPPGPTRGDLVTRPIAPPFTSDRSPGISVPY